MTLDPPGVSPPLSATRLAQWLSESAALRFFEPEQQGLIGHGALADLALSRPDLRPAGRPRGKIPRSRPASDSLRLLRRAGTCGFLRPLHQRHRVRHELANESSRQRTRAHAHGFGQPSDNAAARCPRSAMNLAHVPGHKQSSFMSRQPIRRPAARSTVLLSSLPTGT